MFEDILTTLDELGVQYNEDYEAGTLTISIGDVDKAVLVQLISALNDFGYTYNITDADITVESIGGGTDMAQETAPAPTGDEGYMEALDQLQ